MRQEFITARKDSRKSLHDFCLATWLYQIFTKRSCRGSPHWQAEDAIMFFLSKLKFKL